MELVRIAHVRDFETASLKVFRVLARPVGIFKEKTGAFRAMEVACRHENADLTQGRMVGDIVTCPWHGWKYNLRTGECLWGAPTRLRRYHCEVRENGDIYISMLPIEWDDAKESPVPGTGEDMFGTW